MTTLLTIIDMSCSFCGHFDFVAVEDKSKIWSMYFKKVIKEGHLSRQYIFF